MEGTLRSKEIAGIILIIAMMPDLNSLGDRSLCCWRPGAQFSAKPD